jgi:hypothetical protein
MELLHEENPDPKGGLTYFATKKTPTLKGGLTDFARRKPRP